MEILRDGQWKVDSAYEAYLLSVMSGYDPEHSLIKNAITHKKGNLLSKHNEMAFMTRNYSWDEDSKSYLENPLLVPKDAVKRVGKFINNFIDHRQIPVAARQYISADEVIKVDSIITIAKLAASQREEELVAN